MPVGLVHYSANVIYAFSQASLFPSCTGRLDPATPPIAETAASIFLYAAVNGGYRKGRRSKRLSSGESFLWLAHSSIIDLMFCTSVYNLWLYRYPEDGKSHLHASICTDGVRVATKIISTHFPSNLGQGYLLLRRLIE